MQIDFMRYVLAVAVVAGLLLLSGWVLLPFMAAGVWAAMIVVATWPLLLGLQKLLGGSRALATLIMTLAIVLLLIMPLWMAITAVIDHSDSVSAWVRGLVAQGVPHAPQWVSALPVVGDRVAGTWERTGVSRNERIVSGVCRPASGPSRTVGIGASRWSGRRVDFVFSDGGTGGRHVLAGRGRC
ncbi:MAG: hypothetical protein LRY53_04065 [Burkholderiaceae bacterium]|nr:hypothetical protein [Burkholderiaceae bacterium]